LSLSRAGGEFAEAQPLTPAEAPRETQEYFEDWFDSAGAFAKGARYYRDIQRPKEAAFQLHEAAERLYHCLFLVRTLYSPKTYDLNQLRRFAEDMEPRLKEVWPRSSKFDRRSYELLREAYVKARYSRHYRITDEQLEWLCGRIELLQGIVRGVCEERIAALAEAA
jgi:hypothetical protein